MVGCDKVSGKQLLRKKALRMTDSHVIESMFMYLMMQDANLSTGMLCGSSAWHLPHGKSPVVTFWEGEIVDNVSHTFITSKWGASQLSDMKHWSKFSAFQPLRLHVLQKGGRLVALRARTKGRIVMLPLPLHSFTIDTCTMLSIADN
jgi:hypothetical protein